MSQVEDLFYNVPTRRKAFRSASEEYAKILDLVGRYAVHCVGVAFSCKKHGDALNSISVQKEATTVDRIRQIHGTAVANELLQFEAANESWGFKARGWISNANYSVKKTTLLLFINNRAVESSAIKKAIEQTYAVFLPKGGHPFIYTSLEIDPQRVDVNVHPTKREVNFLNEDEIIEMICDEMRVKLGSVDTSRTFMTQSLLPGVKIPTISVMQPETPIRGPAASDTPARSQYSQKSAPQRTPTIRPYENNLVRTDSRAQKITSFMQPNVRSDSSPSHNETQDRRTAATDEENLDSMEYVFTDRQPTICRLATVKELRATVRDSMHNNLTEVFTTHNFVGIVDHNRRIAAIQSGVKLFLVDYGLCSAEYFYQLGLTDFANYGTIRLDPPLNLRDVLSIAAANEREMADPKSAAALDWNEVVETVGAQLVSRREMLLEYFSLEISEDGDLHGLPLLVKGYMPSMAKLPQFLLRLGPHVDWNDEKHCFRTFLREVAAWYVPEAMPNAPLPRDASERTPDRDPTQFLEGPEITSRRSEISRAVENMLFPAFKARLIATKGMLKGVVEVADLKGLYRVFERC